MRVLKRQRELNQVNRLDFCYLCGRPFTPNDAVSRDHLPPTCMFLKQDHDTPLILPVHTECNAREHPTDELLGQLIADTEGWPDKPGQRSADGVAITVDGRTWGLSRSLNVYRFVNRCVRGFHAALYGQWLPADTRNAFHPPMRGAQIDPESCRPTDRFHAALLDDRLLEQHAYLTEILKRNRVAKSTDSVVSRNGKCIYECVWTREVDGNPACVFGLKIYNWERIGELAGYASRGCVGVFWSVAGRPRNAAEATDLQFRFPNTRALDPFTD